MNSFVDSTQLTLAGAAESDDPVVARLLEEYLERAERGEPVDTEAWIAEHPELASVLRDHLRGLEMLRAFASEVHELKSADGAEPPPVPQLGDYQILGEVGRGGMGVVYEAWQKSLGRKVALKVLPFAAMLDRKQVTRFTIEAQAAAQLHHPHIVPVYSVGCERGIHYYSMQLIAGRALDRVIDELRLFENSRDTAPRPASATTSGFATNRTVKSREFLRGVARVGIQAAEALQHAHEFGIVHRDVKPSNLLIDQQGDAWITDFGLARCQTDLSVTMTGAVIGTVRYMSPEQAAGRGEMVDHRSDIYSLGVTLYELATLRSVFETADREQYLRQLQHDDPTPPHRLNPAIPADLENVLLKAIAKKRTQRYDSAAEFAEDLRRFLDGRPTLAKRPSQFDRAARWVSRHRVAALAAVVILALGAVGAACSTLLLAREAKKTEQALRAAEASLRKSHGAVNHFGLLAAERLADIPQADPVRRELLLDAIRFYEEFIQEVGKQPKLQADMALAHGKRGELLEQLGATNEAITAYEDSIRLLTSLEQSATDEGDHRAEIARCQNNAALLMAEQGDTAKARIWLEQATTLQQKLLEVSPHTPDAARDLARTHGNLGQLLWELGEVTLAEDYLRQSADLLDELVRRFPKQNDLRRDLALRCNNNCFLVQNRSPAEAAAWSDRAIAALEPLIPCAELQERFSTANSPLIHDRTRSISDKSADEFAPDLAVCWNNRAAVLRTQKQLPGSLAAYQRVVETYRQLTRRSPSVVAFRAELAAALNNFGRVEHEMGRQAEAERSIQQACEQLRDLAVEFPDNLAYQNTLGGALFNLATLKNQSAATEEALALYREAVACQRRAFDKSPSSASIREFLSRSYDGYHGALLAANQMQEAVRVADERRRLLNDNR